MKDAEKRALDTLVEDNGVFPILERTLERVEYLGKHFSKAVDDSKKDELVSAVRTFKQVADVWQQLNDLKKIYNDLYDQMSLHQIPEMMKEAGVKTINVEGVGRVTVSYRYSCSMLDKDAGMAWLEETGNGALIQRTVNHMTLTAFAKNMIVEEGKDMPNDIFKVGTIPYTSITKVA